MKNVNVEIGNVNFSLLHESFCMSDSGGGYDYVQMTATRQNLMELRDLLNEILESEENEQDDV